VQPLALPGFSSWSRWQSDRRLFFSSFLLARPEGNVAFDPLPLDEADALEIETLGGVATILLTNRDHERGAAAMRERFGARVLAGRREAASFSLPVDGTFEREALPGIVAVELRGAKTPGEVAFLLEERGVAVVGDAMIGTPAGALSFLPDEKLADPVALALSLRHLWSPDIRTLLLGDGASLFGGAYEALGALLEARGDRDGA
jgi:glyoxylase-like metal-dependent hydrolase (beta-lactamase superfamily II)